MANQEEEQGNNDAIKRAGKRKIEIKPITNKTSKQVTFSKRRNGLFKKASELCSLCGVEIAVVTFSGAGKPFSFGHPNAENVIHRFVTFMNRGCVGYDNRGGDNSDDGDNNCDGVGKISEKYKEAMRNIKFEKTRMINNDVCFGSSSSNGSSPCGVIGDYENWWDSPIDDNIGLDGLEHLKVDLEGLRVEVSSRIDEFYRSSSMGVFPRRFELGLSDENFLPKL